MRTLPALATLLALAFVSLIATGQAIMLSDISDANRAMPTMLACFDHAGRITYGDHFAECRRVAYRPAR